MSISIRTVRKPNHYIVITLILILLLNSCKQENKGIKVEALRGLTHEKDQSDFTHLKIAKGDKLIWVKKSADITGDELVDLLFYSNNGIDSFIGYCNAQRENGLWEISTVSKIPWLNDATIIKNLQIADVDGDNDNDIIGFKINQVVNSMSATTELFWYENEANDKWRLHSSKLDLNLSLNEKGEASFADFDNDTKIDFAFLTNDSNLFVFKQIDSGDWQKVQQVSNKKLHPNVAVGDVNGDAFVDIVSSGFIYYSPGSDLSKSWRSEQLNRKWNNYEEGQASSAKTVLQDVDFDGKVEIFMAPNQVSGYPLIAYKELGGSWQYRIVKDSMAASHQLQVIDFDRDMDFDLVTTRADNNALAADKGKRIIFIENDGSYVNYDEKILDSTFVNHIQILDFDLDGDVDIFLYPKEKSSEFSVMVNTKFWNGSF